MNIARLFLALTLGLLVTISLSPAVQADADGTEVQLSVEILSSKSVPTATGTGIATFTADCGTIIALSAVPEDTLPAAGKPAGVNFPHGLFSCNITNIAACPTVTLTIELPSAVPVGTTYWKCQGGTWVDCTSLMGDDDGDNILTLTLTDGGLGDSDGAADGTIIDPGGPAVVAAAPPAPPAPGGGGGGGGGGEGATACPLALAVNVLGETTTVSMTVAGVLCESCVASGPENKTVVELDEGTQLALANNKVPEVIELKLAGSPPLPSDAAIVGPIYEVNAYPSKYAETPSPVTISPPARIALAYEPDELPENTSSQFIAYYSEDIDEWVGLETAGYVAAGAEIPNTLTSQVSHFTYFAVLARLAPPASPPPPASAPANFEVRNLAVTPSQTIVGRPVTITFQVTNSGGTEGSYTVDLGISGVTEATTEVSLAPGVSKMGSITVTIDKPGTYDVALDGLNSEFSLSLPPIYWIITSILVVAALVGGIMLGSGLTKQRKPLPEEKASKQKSAKGELGEPKVLTIRLPRIKLPKLKLRGAAKTPKAE